MTDYNTFIVFIAIRIKGVYLINNHLNYDF